MLNFPSFFNAQVGGYEIDQSLRFDGSSYLSWADTITPDTAARDLWTLSVWIKRGTLGNQQGIFSAYQNENNRQRITFQPDDTLQSEERGGGASQEESTTNELFRDPSAWYHLTFLYDVNAPGGSGDYVQFWINGVRSNETNAARVTDWAGVVGDSGTTHNIGRVLVSSPTSYFNGYLAELHLCPGQRKAPTDFGEYDDNGVWSPIEYTGSHGTHGYYLKFDPSATNGIGHDHSGNGNNFTPSGFDTTNTTASTYDVMSDTPTTNYATFNPLHRFTATGGNYSPALSDGNLVVTGPTYQGIGRSTIAMSSGKFYFEATITNIDPDALVGIYKEPFGEGTVFWQQTTQVTYYSGTGNVQHPGNTTVQTYSTYTTGDVIGVALDLDNGKVFFSKNGTWQGSSDPAAGTNPAVSGLTGEWTFGATAGSTSATTTANFGQRAFAYTPPTGFKPLNTANLPAPTVKDGGNHFNTVTYAGNGGSNTITTGMDHSSGGGLLWIKNRTTTANHDVLDNVRGLNQLLELPSTAAEYTYTGSNLAATSTGYTLNTSSGQFNASSNNYVAWNWLAGGTGSSNTDGSITSTVSANPSAGFSIGTYTADGSNANRTVGHGLGVAPEFIIVKNRDTTGRHWLIWHKGFNDNDKALLFTDAAVADNRFGPSAPTSTVFGLYGGQGNYNSDDHVFYAFAGVEGYSKFGSYTGNGSTDGPFVFCGFRPAYVWLKGTTFASNWNTYDSARSEYNAADDLLRLNLAAAEVSNYSPAAIDLLSNGFKIRTSSGDWNSNGPTFVFCAFAENPFGGDGVSPATAR